MSAATLKEKMEEFKAGKVQAMQVSGADLAAAEQAGDSNKEENKPVDENATVQADVPKAAKDDIFNDADATNGLHQGLLASYIEDKVDITPDDREAFLQAIVNGGRYERDFELFGGKLKGVFRCRKIAESDGIIAWLNHCINSNVLSARNDYTTLMRNALLAAQVKQLRGLVSEDFPELTGPFGPTRSTDGKEVTPPGWIGLADAWGERPEALVTAIHKELQKFEKRYWAMIADSANQNFWNPAASI